MQRSEIERLDDLVRRRVKGADAALEIARAEHRCLSSAVRKIWMM
jgi:hypothetical protein